jgi:predicted HTH domain antitoxin
MTERTIAVPMPPDLYAELGNVPLFQGRIKEKIQLNLAVGMFVSKEVSLARAAEYAGMTLLDFIDLLNKLGVSTVDYSEEMLDDDIAFAERLSS